MRNSTSYIYLAGLALVVSLFVAPVTRADDQNNLAQLEQQAMRAAAAGVAPSVVKIDTIGGLERVGKVLLGTGPTTGLIVSADGYIISSAFNFVQRPTSILVGLADGTRTPAKLVATDHQRMLVLLKIHVDESLPVPAFVPEDQIQVGQWAIAVGRAFDTPEPNTSVGVVSGLNRIWGKAIQTDAKISPNNYGGPLVDIEGRVLGVLVPLSPESTEDVAGVEWYDSGIGFAVPLAHINAVLPRMTSGADLQPGILGVNLSSRDMYATAPVIAGTRPNSPAAKAGFKAGDEIVEINGHAITRQAQLKEQMGRHYAGDTLHVVVKRGEEQVAGDLTLVDKLEPYARAFFGFLPVRDRAAAEKGVAVRYVYPGSAATQAGLQVGDVLVSLDGTAIENREMLVDRCGTFEVGQVVRVEVRRGSEAVPLEFKLTTEPTEVPTELPAAPELAEPAAGEAAAERPQVGSFAVKVPEFKNECTAYVPESYDPRVSYGLVVWLHPAGGTKDEELLARWRDACDKQHLILLAPRAADPQRWLPQEVPFVAKAIAQIRDSHHIDPQRVAVHGYQAGGSLAYIVAFLNREVVRGVAAIDAPIMGRVPENDPAHRLTIFTTTSKTANFAEQITTGIEQLRKLKYPVTVRDEGEAARQLDDAEFAELLRWLDSLDKI